MIGYSLMFLLGALCGIFCAAMAAAAGKDDSMEYLLIRKDELRGVLKDLVLVSRALVDIMDCEGSDYGHGEAAERADKIVEAFKQMEVDGAQ